MELKKPSEGYIKLLAYIIVVILINVAGITLFFRLDLTKEKIYSISEASKTVVSTLSEPLTIDVFFTKNLPAPHNNTERYLKDLLEEYALYANEFFNYRFYELNPGMAGGEEALENQKRANDYGVYPVQIQAIEEDEVKFIKAYMGLAIIHGDTIEKIPTITSTDGLEYKLTTTIKKLNNKISALLNLSEKVKVKLFFSSSLKTVAPYMGLKKLPNIAQDVRKIVQRLNVKNYGKLEYFSLDPTKDKSLDSEIEKYNILTLKWPAHSKADIRPGEGSVGLVITHKEKHITIPLLHVFKVPVFGTQYEMIEPGELEETIAGGLASIIDINEDIGIVGGHEGLDIYGERPVMNIQQLQQIDKAANIRFLIEQNYTIKKVDLKKEIPSGIKCLIIAGPKKGFTDYELFKIDQFLMQGKNLALFIDSYKQGPENSFGRSAGYVPVNTGLEKLIKHYGIIIKKSYIMDSECYKQGRPEKFGGGWQKIYFAPMIQQKFINNDLKFMKNIKGLIGLKISPIVVDKDIINRNNLKAYKLFSSSEKSWEMTGNINLNPMFISPPDSSDQMKSMPLAYLVQGEFQSYFADKKIPEKDIEEEKEEKDKKPKNKKPENKYLSKIEDKGTFIANGKPGKIIVIGSSSMLTDGIIEKDGRSPVSILIMNILDFLNNREDIAVMRSKTQRLNPLVNTGSGLKTFIKSFNIVGIPLLVIVFGFLIWAGRGSRKRRIQTMFQK